MADPSSNFFVMHGARAAIAAGMAHIQEQVEGIERAVSEKPALAFDLARTLIESACRTILHERNIVFDPGDDLPRLFKLVSQNLPFLPISVSSEEKVRKSLTQTLNGLNTAIHGVCELRNYCGYASHGNIGPRPALEAVQALLAAGTADTIVGFLHRVHIQDRTPSEISRLKYDDNSGFNDYVDATHERVQIFDEEFEPSRILFELATEAYRIYLTEFKPEEDSAEEQSIDAKPTEATP